MPFTFDTKEEFENAVAAISTQQTKRVEDKLKQFKKETSDDFNKQLEQFGAQLGTKFVQLENVLQSKRDKKIKDGKPVDDEPEGGGEPRNDRTRTLEKQIEELRADNKRRDDLLAQERAKTRAITVRQKLREGLEKRGITDPYRLKAAMAVLVDQEKRVGFAESLDDAAGLDTDGAPIELDTFLDSWVKTEEGQFYAPPKGATGSGARPATPRGGAQPQGGGFQDIGEILAEATRNGV